MRAIPNDIEPTRVRFKFSATVTALTLSLLLTLMTMWNVSRESGFLWGVWLIQCLPLLALVPGLLKPSYRAFSWLCFILLLYFIFGVEKVFSSTRDTLDVAFITLVVVLFCASMMSSHYLQLIQKHRPVPVDADAPGQDT